MSGSESDVAHACSVLCRHSCRHPTAQQKGWRTNETRRQDDQKVFVRDSLLVSSDFAPGTRLTTSVREKGAVASGNRSDSLI